MHAKKVEISVILRENLQLKKKVAAQARELSKIYASLHAYKSELRAMTSKLLMSEAAERERIAAELHDHIGQDLLITKLKLQRLHGSGRAGKADETVGQIIGIVDGIVNQTRSLTTRLNSPILYELGLKDAISVFVEKMESGCDICFFTDFTPKPVSASPAGLALLYRGICELIVNAVKHSRAESVVVAIDRQGNRVQATVRDDGVGFPDGGGGSVNGSGTGSGLPDIRQRLAAVDGYLDICSNPGECTEVTIGAPCKVD